MVQSGWLDGENAVKMVWRLFLQGSWCARDILLPHDFRVLLFENCLKLTTVARRSSKGRNLSMDQWSGRSGAWGSGLRVAWFLQDSWSLHFALVPAIIDFTLTQLLKQPLVFSCRKTKAWSTQTRVLGTNSSKSLKRRECQSGTFTLTILSERRTETAWNLDS